MVGFGDQMQDRTEPALHGGASGRRGRCDERRRVRVPGPLGGGALAARASGTLAACDSPHTRAGARLAPSVPVLVPSKTNEITAASTPNNVTQPSQSRSAASVPWSSPIAPNRCSWTSHQPRTCKMQAAQGSTDRARSISARCHPVLVRRTATARPGLFLPPSAALMVLMAFKGRRASARCDDGQA